MPRKFSFDLTLLNLRVDLSSSRQNVDNGEPTDPIRSLRFNICVQTENIRRTLGQNYSDDYVQRWKVSAFRLSNIRHHIFVQEALRESTRKHLDYAKTYRMQPENVARCEQEVIFFPIFLSFVEILILMSQLWPLYPHFFLTSDANAIRCKNLARAYMQKIFANDRWVRQLTTLR